MHTCISACGLLPMEECFHRSMTAIMTALIAVCVVNGELIVDHVPRSLTRTVLYFLGRSSEATCVFAQRSSSTVRTLVPRPYVQYKYIIQKFKNEGLAKVHVYLQPVAMWLL